MEKALDIIASIVTYNNNAHTLNRAIRSFLDTDLQVHLYISDNSPTDALKAELLEDARITYIFNNSNLGFGKAHNNCIRQYTDQCKQYLILNPDVYFDGQELKKLFLYLQSQPEVGLVAPKIVYPDETLQLSCRLLPTPLDLIIRRLPLADKVFGRRMQEHQYQNADVNSSLEVPFLLGCFLLVKSHVLKEVEGFDDRFFMYMEDLDLCRRISQRHKVIYYPDSKIYHIYERASSKKMKILLYHFRSMVQYFNKWGWFNDAERVKLNKVAKQKLGN